LRYSESEQFVGLPFKRTVTRIDMNLIVQRVTALQGSITVPSSKSQSIRGILLALLAEGESSLTNVLISDDTQDAINVCQHLGAVFTIQDNTLIVKSAGLPILADTNIIHSGNSGITTRFVMPLLGLRQHTDQPMILDCGEQMRARPSLSLIEALTHLGLTINYLGSEGQLPIAISGNLKGGSVEVTGITSQYIYLHY
jgi:3-phosphoshikimate 1-carboxyvinyltransferase